MIPLGVKIYGKSKIDIFEAKKLFLDSEKKSNFSRKIEISKKNWKNRIFQENAFSFLAHFYPKRGRF